MHRFSDRSRHSARVSRSAYIRSSRRSRSPERATSYGRSDRATDAGKSSCHQRQSLPCAKTRWHNKQCQRGRSLADRRGSIAAAAIPATNPVLPLAPRAIDTAPSPDDACKRPRRNFRSHGNTVELLARAIAGRGLIKVPDRYSNQRGGVPIDCLWLRAFGARFKRLAFRRSEIRVPRPGRSLAVLRTVCILRILAQLGEVIHRFIHRVIHRFSGCDRWPRCQPACPARHAARAAQ